MLRNILKVTAIAAALLTAGVSTAADIYLRAEAFTKDIPDGAMPPGTIPVQMWGFVRCDSTFTNCGAAAGYADIDSPGPQIDLTDADSLTIHVQNMLSIPVSVIIPGQGGGGDPVALPSDPRRARSLTHETAPSSTDTYTWSSLRTGTYLYQSGTAPSLQVPMGLYGGLVVTQSGTGDPYAGVSADSEAVLLFSEVDPIQNQRVHNAAMLGLPTQACVSIADYAASMTAGFPCTRDYYPALTLVNGEPSVDVGATMISSGDTVILRLLNAGQRIHVPALVGVDLGLIAEDGNLYPGLPRVQSEASLPPGKTLDALITTAMGVDVTLDVFDRGPTYVNENMPNGGMIAGVVVGAGSGTPPTPTTYAVNDLYAVPEDAAPYSAASVLTNDVGLVGATVSLNSGPSNGTLSCPSSVDPICTDGTFDYTPNQDFSGVDAFSYSAELGGNFYPAQVDLDVSFVNDGPTANPDGPYINVIGTTIEVDAAHGVLGNDEDPDGDTLTAVLDSGPTAGTLTCPDTALPGICADGSFSYSGASAASFMYHADDGTAASGSALVTIDFNPVANITLDVHDLSPAAVTSYRWIVQEDATYPNDPTPPTIDPSDTLSTNFHKSFMPVVAQGCVGTECATDNPVVPVAAFNTAALDPSKRYYVSVLPNNAGSGEGHTIGGAQIAAGTTNSTIEVIVNPQPIPTAQVSVLVFQDIQPTNGVPDPGEPGLRGFQVSLEDPAGRYGQGPGIVQQDVDGEPLRNWLADDPMACFGGTVPPTPTGVIVTCDDGTALIKNLPPAKYGIFITAAAGTGDWTQTSTIEGSKVIDAWVHAGEPPYFVEFGVPAYHAFVGFVKPDDIGPAGGSHTITGQVTMVHTARAPDITAYSTGSYDVPLPHTRAWVGLNSSAGVGANIATVHADPDGSFTMTGIPDGTHQLVIWDDYLDTIIFYETVIVSGGDVDVGEIAVPPWFARQEHNVYLDDGCGGGPGAPGYADAIRQDCEGPLTEQNINLRFRDGTIFQAFPTDGDGFVPFDTIFPFLAWMTDEIDFVRYKATGLRVWVDGGGDVSGGPFPGLMYPQVGSPRVEVSEAPDVPVLVEAFQSMPGMTSIFEWGKAPYEIGENGGISGIVFHGTTRGENDPRLTVGDTWEPGIPGVRVRLYREIPTSTGDTTLRFVEEVTTDSWDDSLPTGCPGEDTTGEFATITLGGDSTRCFDGIRNWEQVQPGVFDGGYAFSGLEPGAYVVEVVPPTGYEVIKEEDKNVDFGDAFSMAPVPLMMASAFLVTLPDAAMVAATQETQWGLAAPPCVGPLHTVPATLSLFPGDVDTWAPFSLADRHLCNRKRVILSDMNNAAADFHLFTATPVAGQASGLSTDDIAIEFDPRSASYSDKWGPPFMPISLRDYNGTIVYRGYTDAFGRYNALVPSTFSANLPIPSGYSPAMHSVCLNERTLADGITPDQYFLPQYGTACYTLQYMPGTTTYLDTPLLPRSAFAAGFNPVDCALPGGSPIVIQVDGTGTGPVVSAGGTLTITSQGMSSVPNPDYEGPLGAQPPSIMRDYSFGGGGRVTLDDTPLEGVTWTPGTITGTVPSGLATGTYELVVTRDNGRRSINTVTVTVGETPDAVVSAGGSIQAAIDAADPGDLILVEPDTYSEIVIMWQPVRLQGSGASTIIEAIKLPPNKLQTWIDRIEALVNDGGATRLLPGQPDEFSLIGPDGLLSREMGAGITVFAANDGSFSTYPSRIDGFTITSGDGGGAIYVNGYAHNLVISNNNITGNSGIRHGGIRIGQPYLEPAGDGPFGYNNNVRIEHNSITGNGSQKGDAVAGGIGICTGTDDYTIARNYICGNFSLGDGGGIGHLGYSDNGTIAFNQILFNQNHNQGLQKNGGGLFIGGAPAFGGAALTLGAGTVTVDGNVFQGNQAGSGNGAGLRTQFFNGRDVELNPGDPDQWHRLRATNNLFVNNVAAGWGAGLSFQDTARVEVILNTIAHNDSTATAGAISGGPAVPSGIAVEPYSPALAAAVPGDAETYSVVELTHNVIWQNRAFTFDDSTGTAQLLPVLAPASVGDCAAGANYFDLGVIGGGAFSPMRNILTSTAGYPPAWNNQSADPLFVNAYCNTSRTLSTVGPIQVNIETEEGGNSTAVRYGPLTTEWPAGSPPWDYHLMAGSPAINAPPGGMGQPMGANVDHDVDEQDRTYGPLADLGGDEWWPALRLTDATAPATFDEFEIDFGNIPGNGTVTSTVTVTNYGLATVTIAGVAVTDSGGPVDYTKGADACTGVTLVRGDTCTVDVVFDHGGGGTKTGALTFTHDGNGSPQSFDLTGQ